MSLGLGLGISEPSGLGPLVSIPVGPVVISRLGFETFSDASNVGSQSITVPANVDLMMIALGSGQGNNGTMFSAESMNLDGVYLTQISPNGLADTAGNTAQAGLWGLFEPVAGAGLLSWDWNGKNAAIGPVIFVVGYYSGPTGFPTLIGGGQRVGDPTAATTGSLAASVGDWSFCAYAYNANFPDGKIDLSTSCVQFSETQDGSTSLIAGDGAVVGAEEMEGDGGAIQFHAIAGCIMSMSSAAPAAPAAILNTVVKTASDGWNNCWIDASAVDSGSLAGDFILKWTTDVDGYRKFGVSTLPLGTRDAAYSATINFHIYMQISGVFTLAEGASTIYTSPGSTWSTGDTWEIRRVGNTLSAWRNSVKVQDFTTTSTATLKPTGTIWAQNADITNLQNIGADIAFENVTGATAS
jgi:hypothetical protein